MDADRDEMLVLPKDNFFFKISGFDVNLTDQLRCKA
jgi:hypothetical protein